MYACIYTLLYQSLMVMANQKSINIIDIHIQKNKEFKRSVKIVIKS